MPVALSNARSPLSLLLAITSLATTIVKSEVVPIAPWNGVVNNAGSACDIKWNIDKSGEWTDMNIYLMTGSNQEFIQLKEVATGIDGTKGDGKYTWTCPEVTPNAEVYFYAFSNGKAKISTWTARFTIADANGKFTTPSEKVQPNGDAIPWGTGKLAGTNGGTPTQYIPDKDGPGATQPPSGTTKQPVGTGIHRPPLSQPIMQYSRPGYIGGKNSKPYMSKPGYMPSSAPGHGHWGGGKHSGVFQASRPVHHFSRPGGPTSRPGKATSAAIGGAHGCTATAPAKGGASAAFAGLCNPSGSAARPESSGPIATGESKAATSSGGLATATTSGEHSSTSPTPPVGEKGEDHQGGHSGPGNGKGKGDSHEGSGDNESEEEPAEPSTSANTNFDDLYSGSSKLSQVALSLLSAVCIGLAASLL